MKKIIFTLSLASGLFANLVGGVSIVVKGEAITLYDVKKEMAITSTDAKQASDILIRKKLEEIEMKERKLNVSSTEVYDELKQTAERNNMTINEFYSAVRESNNLSSEQLKERIKERLLSQKLYQTIAYSAMGQPTDAELEEYFKLHSDKFSHPSGFKVIIYAAKSEERLIEKINNPMLYTPDVGENEQELPFNRIAPELAKMLSDTPLNSFTPIIPDGKGEFMSLFIKEVLESTQGSFYAQKENILNEYMSEKREQILGDFFEKLRHNAEITIVRLP